VSERANEKARGAGRVRKKRTEKGRGGYQGIAVNKRSSRCFETLCRRASDSGGRDSGDRDSGGCDSGRGRGGCSSRRGRVEVPSVGVAGEKARELIQNCNTYAGCCAYWCSDGKQRRCGALVPCGRVCLCGCASAPRACLCVQREKRCVSREGSD
jgi:hypothetical protein